METKGAVIQSRKRAITEAEKSAVHDPLFSLLAFPFHIHLSFQCDHGFQIAGFGQRSHFHVIIHHQQLVLLIGPEEYGGMTCVQVGNRMGREEREKAENHPVIVLWHQTVNTIDKRVERGTLEKEIATKAKVRAKDLKDAALADNDYANGEYKNDMNTDTLIATVTKK